MVSFDICGGDRGAVRFLVEAYDMFLCKAETAFQKLQDNSITGDKLYMLWNDCCDRDTEKAIHMILDNDINTINYYINYDEGRGIEYVADEN